MKYNLWSIAIRLCVVAHAFGQSSPALNGTVVDQAGNSIPGVTVTLKDTKTAGEWTTTTNVSGVYSINSLAPGGGYTLTFAAKGFNTVSVQNVAIVTGTAVTRDAQLTAGNVSATVEIDAGSSDATLNTTDATVGNVMGQRQLRELPIQIRSSPAALIGLEPGVVGSNAFAATGGLKAANRTGSVTGSRADQGNITVDGIDANDQVGQTPFLTVANAPIDSIQEFRAITAGFNATEGRSSGGQVMLTTNSGTNAVRGNVREYYRNEKTAANSFFNNKIGIVRPRLRRHQYGGTLGGPLPMLNFGENDGPIVSGGRDKRFFFFDAEIRRDRSETTAQRQVPLPSLKQGLIGYINNNPGCTNSARINTTPNCISFQSLAQTQTFDPLHIGANPAILSLLNSRYPDPNDLTGGDGRNTGLLRWNAPNFRDDQIYTGRVDLVPTSKQRLFVRTTITRRSSTNGLQLLPGDPDTSKFKDRSWSLASADTWAISGDLSNVITVGVTRQVSLLVPGVVIPSFPTFYSTFFGRPYNTLAPQDERVTVPTIKDEITFTRGNHTFYAGMSFKPIRQKSLFIGDANQVFVGMGGLTNTLNASLRPANIRTAATSLYDNVFAFMLGRLATSSTGYYFDKSGNAYAPGTGKRRTYAFNEYEPYVQDNWRIGRSLVLNLGLRYHLYPAPYEVNGFQADNSINVDQLIATRVANAAAGIATPTSEPLMVYDLSGKVNHGAPLYRTDRNNFAPRLGFNFHPATTRGLGGLLFGSKTSIHGSMAIAYDRVAGIIPEYQNQTDYLFANSSTTSFGNANPVVALTTGPRFTGLTPLPAPNVPPVISRPYTPGVTNGIPTGVNNFGSYNYAVDHNLKVPYAYLFNFGYQRELPGSHLLDVTYVGRIGRQQLTQLDVAQVMNFKDPASGQLLFSALNQLQSVIAANVAAGRDMAFGVTPIAWFENQMNAASIANYGVGCSGTGYGANCTEAAVALEGDFIRRGDTADLMQDLAANGFLRLNVGLSGQTASNGFMSTKGTSDYHGLLISLQKRFSRGFEYEVNYTFSKSLDSNSTTGIYNVIDSLCDIVNPKVCRGPSDFDIRHLFNANFIWQLPFGRHRAIGRSMNGWVDAAIGGWTISGIINARSGVPLNPRTDSYNPSYYTEDPAVVIGNPAALKSGIHNVGSSIQFFANPAAADAALRFPRHGEVGSRNYIRGPRFWGADARLSKKFTMPWNEGHKLSLMIDAFNLTNTKAFSPPSDLMHESSSFGVITGTANQPREIQFGLRYDW